MDAHRFDHVAKALAFPGARRRLLLVLAAFPLVAGLASFLDEDEATALRRRKR